ncbi:uncharacterized protein K452DRAFT_362958 [Aplosporella prunicola CBS 121167]|uniref:Uncharacterized protein n=1 Tax=Aplosporella prunicola CBS 121167 TaxID=1176127 RepID=A0A6A6AZ67_9PEZI|nr:uncharacterized protein K452DRAFT_362958 [Aplosporella prunicola CBS 121167]KAF2135761.1 hypothetical protein K452DRAFT_362958 [Aplosporella prunicola CBS 121167]
MPKRTKNILVSIDLSPVSLKHPSHPPSQNGYLPPAANASPRPQPSSTPPAPTLRGTAPINRIRAPKNTHCLRHCEKANTSASISARPSANLIGPTRPPILYRTGPCATVWPSCP